MARGTFASASPKASISTAAARNTMDPGLNTLLKWAVENTDSSKTDGEQPQELTPKQRQFDTAALNALLGGPSDADLMKHSMAAIVSEEVSLDQKLIAFDNLEQLVESIDNANNLEPLGLWAPLVAQLGSSEPQLRSMAAWCIGTAVQNNPKAQAKAHELGSVPLLVQLALSDPVAAVRQKAIYALSSEIRNFAPAFGAALPLLPRELVGSASADLFEDMELIDSIMAKLRERSQQIKD